MAKQNHAHEHEHTHSHGCDCGCEHGELSLKENVIRLCIAAVFLVCGLILHHYDRTWWCLAACILAYIPVGLRVVREAAENLLHGKVFDENFLMSVATIGAFFVGEYPEAAAVMLFYRVGELFEDIAVDRSRRSISALMEIRPDAAHRKTADGIETIAPQDAAVGDILVVSPGERIPLDGLILSGTAQLDTSALTGESLPRTVQAGDMVPGGCIDLDGVLEIRTEKVYAESTVHKILELVENASSKKSRSESFISRFAAWYTPVIVALAVLLAVVPPLVTKEPFSVWVYSALNFLVVSCPCALVISVPLSFFGGIGGASKAGILVKGSTYLEALSRADTVVFDKTGTLTEGVFRVAAIHAETMSSAELLYYAAGAEQFSSHPIAVSLCRACPKMPAQSDVRDMQNHAGKGVYAVVNGKEVLAGNEKLMRENGICVCVPAERGAVVYVAVDGIYAGAVVICDNVKADAQKAVAALKADGIRTVLLTGDRRENADDVAKKLGLDAVYAELLPADKVAHLEEIQKKSRGKVIYVGDGINDAPVLALADIGIAMGKLGSDAAIEAADVVIMNDALSSIGTVRRISAKTLRIVRENIVLALAVKAAILLSSALQLTGLWVAVFADVGVCILAVLNALRALRK